jgi:hypothetical protein
MQVFISFRRYENKEQRKLQKRNENTMQKNKKRRKMIRPRGKSYASSSACGAVVAARPRRALPEKYQISNIKTKRIRVAF